MTFRDPRCDRTDPDFRNQLDADSCRGIGILQVEEQLSQVFDRVDIVMRRRTDQTDAGSRVTSRSDDLVDLVTGQLAPFTGLGSLRNLDLKFVGVRQIPTRHAEAS